jgi:uncharacterized protein (TIGR00255 family)
MRSMTGFGRAALKHQHIQIEAEVRALNQRFMELKLALPRGWGEHEAEIRKLVQGSIARGRVEVAIRYLTLRPPRNRLHVDEQLAKSYVAELRRLAKQLKLSGSLEIDAILSRPEIFQPVEETLDGKVSVELGMRALKHALKAVEAEREREGKVLRRDLATHLARIESAIPRITKLADKSRAEIMANFESRLRSLLQELPINEKRLHEEATAAAQRADIAEELARLRAHTQALKDLLSKTGPVGKEIEFLLQEVNREVNTIGAKSQSAELSRVTVEVKGRLEKMREQVQNVE